MNGYENGSFNGKPKAAAFFDAHGLPSNKKIRHLHSRTV